MGSGAVCAAPLSDPQAQFHVPALQRLYDDSSSFTGGGAPLPTTDRVVGGYSKSVALLGFSWNMYRIRWSFLSRCASGRHLAGSLLHLLTSGAIGRSAVVDAETDRAYLALHPFDPAHAHRPRRFSNQRGRDESVGQSQLWPHRFAGRTRPSAALAPIVTITGPCPRCRWR